MEKADTSIPVNSSWWLGLLVLLALIALPTGYDALFLPWFCVEFAGTGLLLWLWWQGETAAAFRAWRIAAPLSVWLCSSMAIAALQLASGFTESRFDTFRQMHFFAGGLFLIPLAARAFPALKASVFQNWTALAASALLAVSLLSGSLALLQPNPAGSAIDWWPFIYRNHYAAFVLLLLPPLCWHAFAQAKFHWGAAVGVVAGIAGVVGSASRSGIALLALTLGMLGLLIWLQSQRAKRRYVLAATLGIAAMGALLANSDGISWRLQHGGSMLEGRLDYWQATFRMIAERPLLGWGFGTWPDVYPQFLIRDAGIPVNRAHSDWLEFFAEGGFLPVLALGVLGARSLWLAFRHPWSMGVPAVLLLAMADYPLRLPILLLAIVAVYVTAEFTERRTAGTAIRSRDA